VCGIPLGFISHLNSYLSPTIDRKLAFCGIGRKLFQRGAPRNPGFLPLVDGLWIFTVKLLSALLAMTVSASAAPGDPGETAIMFLEKVRTKNLNLEPGADTALSPQTSEKKRREIARQHERMARDLGSDPLELGSVKQDDDLAAVLVRKIGGFDQSRLQVFPVALVKRGAEWIAAPLPASFENTGARHAASLRTRLEALEEWMLRERVLDLDKLHQESEARMRSKIEQVFPAATLRSLNATQAVARFLDACENRKLLETLGLIGGLSAELPDDWALRVKHAENALQGNADSSRTWRQLVAPEVLRVPVYQEEDGDTALVSIACLDPREIPDRPKFPRTTILHLNLSKTTEGMWRINPPRDEPDLDDGDADANPDSKLLEIFPSKLALKFPAAPAATAALAKDALLAALASPLPSSWVPLAHTQGDPEQILNTHAIAARTWWELRNPASNGRAILLAFREEKDHAVAACQFFDVRNTDKLNLRFLFFNKTPMGWMWEPAPSEEIRKIHQEWTSAQSSTLSETWRDTLLAECQKLDVIPSDGAPTEEEAHQLVSSWLETTQTGDLTAALRLIARLGTEDSGITMLRNLGYEINGARRSTRPANVGGISRSGRWAAVSTQTMMDGRPAFPFYPVVRTPSGPRILLEISLIYTGTRSRDFINKSVIENLRKVDRPAADDLAELFARHQAANPAPAKP
jgi:hypothetical protein